VIRLQEVRSDGDVASLLAALPGSAGVGQVLGPEGQSLLIGAPANLRRWAAANLGAGPPPPKGKRPRTDLSPVTQAIAFATSTSAFHQRLTYERLMARYVPASARRDLKPPVFLHLDPAARFPRITLRGVADELASCHGPFRDRRAAEKARTALQKLLALRPCDYVFEPDPALPLGLSCLFAQVRSCAAPCLGRSSEDAYRDLARSAAELLARPERRSSELQGSIPAAVGPADGRGLVIERTKAAVEVYPVAAGAVLEEGRVVAGEAALDEAVRDLRWDPRRDAHADWPWLAAWLASPRGRRSFVCVPADIEAGELGSLVRAHLQAPR
jgi:hypothetical protein